MTEKLGGVRLKQRPVRSDEPGISLLLSNLRPGNRLYIQCLPLQRLDKDLRLVRTEYFLKGELECKDEGRFFFRVRANFGKKKFEDAILSVKGSGDATASLIWKGRVCQVTGLPINVPAEKEKVVLEVFTVEANGDQNKFFAVLRNTPPKIEGEDNEPTIPFGFPVDPSEETR